MISLVLVFALGLIVGLLHKGIHIHVDKSDLPKKEGFNESMAGYLPPEVQNYYSQTKGQNLF